MSEDTFNPSLTDDGEPVAEDLARTVSLIREAGFSVNGSDAWSHSVDVYVAPRDVVIAAQRLVIVLAQAGYPVLDPEGPIAVDATYYPMEDWAMICVYGISDSMLPHEAPSPTLRDDGKAAN